MANQLYQALQQLVDKSPANVCIPLHNGIGEVAVRARRNRTQRSR
jgi:hypothetical protein